MSYKKIFNNEIFGSRVRSKDHEELMGKGVITLPNILANIIVASAVYRGGHVKLSRI